MPLAAGRPPLTVAVIHHHVRGYPDACMDSLRAAAPEGTEFLLIESCSVGRGDRATAKNLAIARAQGDVVLLATSDCVAGEGAIEAVLRFLAAHRAPVAASAQLLLENGMRRPTGFRLPSLWREVNLPGSLWRLRRLMLRPKRPWRGPPHAVPAVHASFLVARRGVFETVGAFTEGYRFGAEDLEWCARAARKGVGVFIVPEAEAFKMPPQLHGPVGANERAAIEESYCRLIAALHSPAYSRCYRAVRKAKVLLAWLAASALSALLCGRSQWLVTQSAVNRAIWSAPLDGRAGEALPPDIESQVRWEAGV